MIRVPGKYSLAGMNIKDNNDNQDNNDKSENINQHTYGKITKAINIKDNNDRHDKDNQDNYDKNDDDNEIVMIRVPE